MNEKTAELLAITAFILSIVAIYTIYTYAYLIALAGGGTLALAAMGGSIYAWQYFRMREAKIAKQKAKVFKVEAEGLKLLQTTTAVKPGHEAVITQIQHPRLTTHVNTQHFIAPPLEKPITVINQGVAKEVALIKDNDYLADIKQGDWLTPTLFDEAGNLKAYHVKADGPTGVGKTYLILKLISMLQYPYPSAEYWLLDPKFEGKSSGWPFEPFVESFDEMATGASYLYENVILKRRKDKANGKEINDPSFFIFDEVDGSFDELGQDFIKPVRRSIREGRSVLAHVIMAGQSPLIKENGFSTAIFQNTLRFVLGGNLILSFIRNPQFNFYDKELRQGLANQAAYCQGNGLRAALVIPAAAQGAPFIGQIPQFNLADFKQKAKVDDAIVRVKTTILDLKVAPEPTKAVATSELTPKQTLAVGAVLRLGSIAKAAREVYGTGSNQRALVEAALVKAGYDLADFN